MRGVVGAGLAVGFLYLGFANPSEAQPCSRRGEFNDAHFHLTNYVQEGITPAQLLQLMGDRVPRSTLFGFPLHQQWSYRLTGKFAPRYYLESDAHLYYYSFTTPSSRRPIWHSPPNRGSF